MRDALRRDGFVVVPGHLHREDVTRLRVACTARLDRYVTVGGGRVVSDLQKELPRVYSLLTSERTLSVARALIGDRVLHLHQNAVHAGPVNRGWHKDALDYIEGRAAGPDTRDDYRLLHFAWYLQDHVHHGGGISFRRGSHRIADDRGGEPVTPDVRAGDLVVFDLRTTHFGNTIRLRNGRPVYVDRLWRTARAPVYDVASRIVGGLPRMFLPEHGAERLVVFSMYGADDDHTRRFFHWLRTQPDLAHVRRYRSPVVVSEESA